MFSFNLWSGWHPLGFLPAFAGTTAYDLLDHLTSNVMLPIGGFALSLFAGWALPQAVLAEELLLGNFAGTERIRCRSRCWRRNCGLGRAGRGCCAASCGMSCRR